MIQIKSPLLPLQAAARSLLAGVLGSIPIFDDVPEASAYPYVVIGYDSGAAWYTKTRGGMEIRMTVHVWSQYRGFAEAKQVLDTVIRNVTGTGFSLVASGFNCLPPVFEFTEYFTEPDGLTRHGVARFIVRIADL